MGDQILETLIDEKELSRLLRVSVATLRFWRRVRQGPRYRKIGQLVRYAPSDIHNWLRQSACGGEMAEVAR
jgi:predicted DNA-binding transcriptional regulator AlpA